MQAHRKDTGIGADKYDAPVASMIALLKYGSGLPFNRLDRLQGNLEVPLPASTQWEIVSGATEKLEPVYEELIRQAAQGEVVHNDDTTVKILELMGKRAKQQAFAEAEKEGKRIRVRACSPRASWRPALDSGWPSFSADASTPARILWKCFGGARPSCRLPSKSWHGQSN